MPQQQNRYKRRKKQWESMHLTERHNFAPQPPSEFLFILQNCTPPRAAAATPNDQSHTRCREACWRLSWLRKLSAK